MLPGESWPTCAPPAGGPGFNPRPALLPGESALGADGDEVELVSIRARHCYRANLDFQHLCIGQLTFQSAPGIATGRIACQTFWRPSISRFNPRPALLPGESTGNWLDPALRNGFNPRPALLPGESGIVRDIGTVVGVSIRARHCCRANQPGGKSLIPALSFQSAPGIAAGRIGDSPY